MKPNAKYRLDLKHRTADDDWQKTEQSFFFDDLDVAKKLALKIINQTNGPNTVAIFEQSNNKGKIQYIYSPQYGLYFDPFKRSNKQILSDTINSALFSLDDMAKLFYDRAEKILKSRGEKIKRSDIRFIRENVSLSVKEEAAANGEMAIAPEQVKTILPKSFDVIKRRME